MYTITLCCSKKFKKQERAFAKELRSLGINVYEPPLHTIAPWDSLEEADKVAFAAGTTFRHFNKIAKSDAIFVLNIDRYIGPSTGMEIGYAAALHKKIFFFENDEDYPRKILADGFANTPQELVKLTQQVETPDILD